MSLQTKRLFRSRDDRMIAGVCGGLGEYLGIDATIVRLLLYWGFLHPFPACSGLTWS